MFKRGTKVKLAENEANSFMYPILVNKTGEIMESNKYKSRVRFKTKMGFYEVIFMNHVLESVR